MMSLPRLRDSSDFSPYSSSAEWTDEDKMSSALLEVDVEGPTVAGSALFTGLKKEDMEEGPAVPGGYGGRASCSKVGRCDRDGMSDWLGRTSRWRTVWFFLFFSS
ncbi:hypothetical protein E2C01_083694 [Portunus trituberculatus]|uniref:Uncharacterized protein n=1 Tax=Portunus trituberculatus TaxID=210409 RepID=A0A5B7J2U7_PORTR|nr:hypothetical protein [Portunus trituberculatus]